MHFTSAYSLALVAVSASQLYATALTAPSDTGVGMTSHPDISGNWVALPHKVHRFFYKTGESDMLHNSTSDLYIQQDGCHLWGNRTWSDTGVMEGSESLVGSFLGGPEDHIRILSIPGSESNGATFKEASVRYDGTHLHYVVVAYTADSVGVSYTAVYEREQ